MGSDSFYYLKDIGVFYLKAHYKRFVVCVKILVFHEAAFVALFNFSPSLCCHETWKLKSLNMLSEFNPGVTGILKAD